MTTSETFSHRDNADGTIDSICPLCIEVVATSYWEADLDRAEGGHRCDPEKLDYLRDLLESREQRIP